jgi:hypothetical protein
MALQFHRAIKHMEIWSASSEGFSFVITYGSPTGPGFHGRAGYVASWRPLIGGSSAIKIGGSPFKMLAEAEEACNAILKPSDKRRLNSGAARAAAWLPVLPWCAG